jgi:hypothetical protein
MIIVKYENEIRGKSLDALYTLFLNMTPERYIQMHPIHHKEWRVIKRSAQGVGTIIYGHEEYGKYRLRGKAYIITAIYPKLIIYKQSRIVPILMIFYFKSIIGGTKLISILKIGFNNKYMCFIDWIIKKIFLTERFLLTHLQHVNEEFKNLESM